MSKEEQTYTVRISTKRGASMKGSFTYTDATGYSLTQVPGMFLVEFEDEVKFFNLDEIAMVTVPRQDSS